MVLVSESFIYVSNYIVNYISYDVVLFAISYVYYNTFVMYHTYTINMDTHVLRHADNITQVFISFVLMRITINILFKNVDGALHFIYAHKYNTNTAEASVVYRTKIHTDLQSACCLSWCNLGWVSHQTQLCDSQVFRRISEVR